MKTKEEVVYAIAVCLNLLIIKFRLALYPFSDCKCEIFASGFSFERSNFASVIFLAEFSGIFLPAYFLIGLIIGFYRILSVLYGGPQVHTNFKSLTPNLNHSHYIQITRVEFKSPTPNSNC